MKKLLLFCLLLFISAESIQTAAQESKETKKEQGIFNSVAVGLGVGTTGINIDVASPIGNHFALRGEVNIMPGFSYSDEVDASVLLDRLDHADPLKRFAQVDLGVAVEDWETRAGPLSISSAAAW